MITWKDFHTSKYESYKTKNNKLSDIRLFSRLRKLSFSFFLFFFFFFFHKFLIFNEHMVVRDLILWPHGFLLIL
jgi:hypothetical protein